MSDLEKLAEDIAGRGVERIFGIPGSGPSLTLLDALEKAGVTFYLTHFEGTAAIMAGVQGRLTGKAGVAISIKGPGLSNMIPGLAVCRFEAMPVVSISEAYTPETPASKAHKRLDHEGLLSAVAKGRRFLSKTGPRFSDMTHWAESEVPGPVHLDIAGSAIEEDESVPVFRETGKGDFRDEELFDLVAGAERPVLIAGTLSIRKHLSSHLNGLSVPVFSTAAAKGVIDETLPHSAGVYTGVGLELAPENSVLGEADLILGIGLRHNEILGVKPFQCKSINVDPKGKILCNGFNFDHVLEGTSKEMDTIFSALGQKAWGLESLRQCQKRMREKLIAGDFMPASAFSVIEKHFQHRARLVLDTGNFCTIGEHIWRVPEPGWYVASGQGRYMGAGLPMALGASIYDPEVPTVVFLGDGGIGMFLADMKLAVKHRLPLIVVLMSDAYLGSIRVRSIKDDLTEKPVTIHQPSWMKAVEGLGVEACRAESEQAVEDILNSWDLSKGPLFIELHFDPENYQQMVNGIR